LKPPTSYPLVDPLPNEKSLGKIVFDQGQCHLGAPASASGQMWAVGSKDEGHNWKLENVAETSFCEYPLVTNIAMERSTIFHGKSIINGNFQ
jgi:hypothetical protein